MEGQPERQAPIHFALVSEGEQSRSAWVDTVRKAEDLGYEALYITDHLHQPLAPLVALSVATEHSTTLRLGTYVLNHDFRHPLVLAKEIRTLMAMAGDRVDVGLGAGWLVSDYASTGIPFREGPRRASRFEQYVTIVWAALVDGVARFDLPDFTVDAEVPPAGNLGTPRLLLGAGGPRLLRFAARHADVVSVLPRSLPSGGLDEDDATAEVMDNKVELVRREWQTTCRRGHLNNLIHECLVSPRAAELLALLARGMGCGVDEVNDRPTLLVGDTTGVVEILRARQLRWGIDYVTIPADAAKAFAPVIARMQ